jgi:hypothetical protein
MILLGGWEMGHHDYWWVALFGTLAVAVVAEGLWKGRKAPGV